MMKRLHVAGLALAVFAFVVTAQAQNSTSQFVIGGETAKKIHDFSTINLATAERIAEKCEDLARKEGVAIASTFWITTATTSTCIAWTGRAISILSPRR